MVIEPKITKTLYQGLLYKANVCCLAERDIDFRDFLQENEEVFSFLKMHTHDYDRLKKNLNNYFDHNQQFFGRGD